MREEELLVLTSFGLHPLRPGVSCDGLLAVTRERLLVAVDGEITVDRPLSEIVSLSVESAVGCCFVEYVTKDGGEAVRIARTDNQQSHSIHEAIRRVNRFLSEGELSTEHRTHREERRCPRCGRPYPRGGHTCPRCVSKKESLLRLVRMAAPEWGYILVAAVLFVLNTLVGLLLPYLNRVMVDDYARQRYSVY